MPSAADSAPMASQGTVLGAEGELRTSGRPGDWGDEKFMKQPERKESETAEGTVGQVDPLWRPGTETVKHTEETDASAGEMSLADLQDRKIWASRGVDPGTREEHLGAEEFQSLFGMAKSEWGAVPKWKKDNLKKKHGLF